MSNKTVVVGMSGGVDSSVSAYLLKKQGFNVIGLFMKNWQSEPGEVCTSEIDFEDASKVCDELDIQLHKANFSDEYWERVFTFFLSEHAKGRTPNPDILCNREIKFKAFIHYAKQIVEKARTQLAELTYGDPNGFMFTSGGTEANNTALLGFEKVITCITEHDAVLAARPDAEKIGVGADGEINLVELETQIQKAKNGGGEIVVSVMLVNNETGRIQPIEKLLEICQFYKSY